MKNRGMSDEFDGNSEMKSKSIRYATPNGFEAEFEPGSRGRVLRNLKGIRRKREMDQREFEALVRVQEMYLEKIENDMRFTANLICEMHRDWLGNLYPWAGKYRTVELAKAGFSWPPAYLIEQNMVVLEQGALHKCTPCKPGALTEVTLTIAEVHAELLLIHPFREGNGRLARWLAELMALQAGLALPLYHFTGRGSMAEKARYLSAVKSGYVRDYRPLADFFAEAIERGETVL